jgi:hypothetical protein
MIARLGQVARFLYDFVIGDDPLIAVAVVAGLGLTGYLVGEGVSAWWALPIVVVAVLSYSLHRAART